MHDLYHRVGRIEKTLGGLVSPILLLNVLIDRENILSLLEEKIVGSTYFVVELSIGVSNKIKLEIDKPDGISIRECVEFSRLIEKGLNREEEDFELEVTSPGLTKPLRVREQYVKNIGKKLDVFMTGAGKKLTGTLLEVNEDSILLTEVKKEKQEGRKKKQWIHIEHKIELKDINKTFVVIEINR